MYEQRIAHIACLWVGVMAVVGCGARTSVATDRSDAPPGKVSNHDASLGPAQTDASMSGSVCGDCAGQCMGSRCLTRLEATKGPADDLAVDDQFVYVADSSAGAISRIPKQGGRITVLAEASHPSRIAVDSQTVFWTSNVDSGIHRVAKSGGSPTSLVAHSGRGAAIAVRDGTVFWTAYPQVGSGAGTLWMLSPSGTQTALGTIDQTGDIAVDAFDVYCTTTFAGSVLRVPIGGGPITTLAASREQPSGIVVDGSSVYWLEGDLASMPLDGTSPPAILAAAFGGDSRLAADASNLYTAARIGKISKVGKRGGPVTTLASSLELPFALVVDDTSVYFITGQYGSGGAIWKLTPK